MSAAILQPRTDLIVSQYRFLPVAACDSAARVSNGPLSTSLQLLPAGKMENIYNIYVFFTISLIYFFFSQDSQ